MSTNTKYAAIPETDQTTLYRAARGRVDLLDVPELLFAAVDGHGAPDGHEFQDASAALYAAANGVRFALRDRGINEKVSLLESLWWSAGPEQQFARHGRRRRLPR
jgi:hypothetical protein